MAAILASLHMRTADDLFGTPQGSPRTDKLIAASVQWARLIMVKVIESAGKIPADDSDPTGLLRGEALLPGL